MAAAAAGGGGGGGPVAGGAAAAAAAAARVDTELTPLAAPEKPAETVQIMI